MEISSGIIFTKKIKGKCHVLLGHVYNGKEPTIFDRSWGIPKGKVENGESLLDAALREFYEETGLVLNKNYYIFGQENRNVYPLVSATYNTYVKGQKTKKNLRAFLAIDLFNLSDGFNFISKINSQGFPEFDSFQWVDIDLAAYVVMFSQKQIFHKMMRLKNAF